MSSDIAEGVAPGRLDMMGGVADYSGSYVLEVATVVTTRVRASLQPCASGSEAISAHSLHVGADSFPLHALYTTAAADIDLKAIGAAVRAACPTSPWMLYVVGVVASYARSTGWTPPPCHSLSLHISSSVPHAQGVSSSASLEVALLRALVDLNRTPLSDLKLAHMGQAAENSTVGAACGLMDQLACACGSSGRVTPILCRPDQVEENLNLPAGVLLVGWPSGVKHSVSASPYLVARTATFMAKTAVQVHTGSRLEYLTCLTPSALSRIPLPHSMTGADFASRYGGVDDPLSVLQPEVVYPVSSAARFAVEENHRCAVAASLLKLASMPGVREADAIRALQQIGECMRESHEGYNAIGLGSAETDAMVAAVCDIDGVYGARVSGGGSGGTVVVLCREGALPAVEQLATRMTFGTPFPGLIR